MPSEAALAVHTLLRVKNLDSFIWDETRPEWAAEALQFFRFVVVRRAVAQAGILPVGVRGNLRSQRAAASVSLDAVLEYITPQMLAARRVWQQPRDFAMTPAVAALDAVAAIFSAHGLAERWGPGGSVGVELAAGVPCSNAASDLDLVLRADAWLTRTAAARLHADLCELPVRVDLLLETPNGAVALAEYADNTETMLLRSARGPRLVRDPFHA